MFHNHSSLMQSWLQSCEQLNLLSQQISLSEQKLIEAKDFCNKIYDQLPWFYLCRATQMQIQRYEESKVAVVNARKELASIKVREHQLISNKQCLYDSMLDQDSNYRKAKTEVDSWNLLLSKSRFALNAVENAIYQLRVTISEKEKDLIQDIREQQAGESNSGWRNYFVSCEFDSAKAKIRNAKQVVTEFSECLRSEFPEEVAGLQSVLPFVDDSIGHASCGDWWTNLDDSPVYGMHLIRKMGIVQGQLQALIPALSKMVTRCDFMHAQSISKRVEIQNAFDVKLMSHHSGRAVVSDASDFSYRMMTAQIR